MISKKEKYLGKNKLKARLNFIRKGKKKRDDKNEIYSVKYILL